MQRLKECLLSQNHHHQSVLSHNGDLPVVDVLSGRRDDHRSAGGVPGYDDAGSAVVGAGGPDRRAIDHHISIPLQDQYTVGSVPRGVGRPQSVIPISQHKRTELQRQVLKLSLSEYSQ
ncbi:hypothetical protein MUK42_35916 [Musa troglodytarum]|uniref:Uncharacterized protein n=1 Tax=Musa troglodytarum TaxID=320322 RepID=A0A9E7GDA9_9LILI|nr:hypothetical protein MUK42_35916 [Musa troglodytarum]